MSARKTKEIKINSQIITKYVCVNNVVFERVEQVTYLGSLVTVDAGTLQNVESTNQEDFSFLLAQQPTSGPGPPHSRCFYIAHNDAPQSVGLLWTSDKPVAETST